MSGVWKKRASPELPLPAEASQREEGAPPFSPGPQHPVPQHTHCMLCPHSNWGSRVLPCTHSPPSWDGEEAEATPVRKWGRGGADGLRWSELGWRKAAVPETPVP